MARKKKVEPVEPEIYQYEPEPQPEPSADVEIMPLRDFHIVQNQIDIIIKKGEPVTIPRQFLQNMVTEKVIETIPK